MKTFYRWIPSVLIILTSAIILSATFRGLGPRGSGVGLMLKMQHAWTEPSTFHAAGTVEEAGLAGARRQAFNWWRASDGTRRIELDDPSGSSITYLLTPSRAWRLTSRPPSVQSLPPDSVNLEALPDPDSGSSYYRWIRSWNSAGTARIMGHSCLKVTGTAPGTLVTFFLDDSTYLPWRVEVERTDSAGPGKWTVDYHQFDTRVKIDPALLLPRARP